MKFLAYSNWTKSVYYNKKILYPQNLSSLKKIINSNQIGICGNLRSFNDACINKNKLVSLKKFSKKIFLDKKKLLLHVSSNYLLIDVLKKIVPQGYMISVSPGSKYVTIGGMISNNVIGKNSENNQFRYILKELKILCTNNKILTCSNKKNKKLFDLTIGGFGLTGIILAAVIKLKRIRNQKIDQEIFKFHNFKEFENIANKKTKFNVSWIDSHYLNKKKLRGLFYYGNYSKKKDFLGEYKHNNTKVNFLTNLFLRIYISNFYFSKFTNLLFFKFKKKREEVSFDQFFYPQDKWLNFNECYSKGFFQIQFLIPQKKFKDVMNEICDFFKIYNLKSTFIILKKINEKGKYLNFYGKGYSISFDFENNHQTKNVKNFFSNLIFKNKLRTNFSKDIIQKYEFIKDEFEYNKFKKEIKNLDKKRVITNEFSKRLKLKSIR